MSENPKDVRSEVEEARATTDDAVSILHRRYVGNDELRQRQLEAERALNFLETLGVANLDIERTGADKLTLTELLTIHSAHIRTRERERAAQIAENHECSCHPDDCFCALEIAAAIWEK